MRDYRQDGSSNITIQPPIHISRFCITPHTPYRKYLSTYLILSFYLKNSDFVKMFRKWRRFEILLRASYRKWPSRENYFSWRTEKPALLSPIWFFWEPVQISDRWVRNFYSNTKFFKIPWKMKFSRTLKKTLFLYRKIVFTRIATFAFF